MKNEAEHNGTSFTPSELIYLFVDGEADDIQRSMLFSALAGDVDLQAELGDAIRINTAARSEMNQVAPPASVTDSLFERAGIAPAPIGGGGAGSGLSAGGATAVIASGAMAGSGMADGKNDAEADAEEARRNPFLFLFLQRFGVPLATGFVGALLALWLIPGFMGEPERLAQSTLADHAISQQELSTLSNNPSASGNSIESGITEGRRSDEAMTLNDRADVIGERSGAISERRSLTTPPAENVQSRRDRNGGEKNRVDTRTKEHVNRATIAPTDRPPTNEVLTLATENDENHSLTAQQDGASPANEADAESDPVQNSVEASTTDPANLLPPLEVIRPQDSEPLDIKPAAEDQLDSNLLQAFQQQLLRDGLNGALRLDREALSLDRISESDGAPQFSVGAKGIASLQTFPERSTVGADDEGLSNLALSVRYHANRHHSFNVEGGREYNPLYIDQGKGGSILMFTTLPVVQTPVINGAGGNGGGSGSGIVTNTDQESSFDTLESTKTYIPSGRSVNTIDTATYSGYELQSNFFWGGVGYRFQAEALDRLGMVRPFAQGLVGASTVGPLGKLALGLSWKPDARVSFDLAVEGTSQLYRQVDGWYSSAKLGMTYGVSVDF